MTEHSLREQLRRTLVDNRLLDSRAFIEDALDIIVASLRVDIDDRAFEVANNIRDMREQIDSLIKERNMWKKRAEQHGCDTKEGDPECG